MSYIIHLHDLHGIENLETNGLGWYAGAIRTEGARGVPECGRAKIFPDIADAVREAQKIAICCPGVEITAVVNRKNRARFVDAAQSHDWPTLRELCDWIHFNGPVFS